MAQSIRDGQFTSTIYGLIRERRHKEAVTILNQQLARHPDSRAGLSLLGYCHYQLQDFVAASDCYEQLSLVYTESVEYQLYFAQSLYQAGLYEQAMRVASQIEDSEQQLSALKLKAAIKYGEGDIAAARGLVDQCDQQDPDTIVNAGCLLHREGKFQEAAAKFQQAARIQKFRPDLAYNTALCHYSMKQYPQALKFLGDVIERGIRDRPELGVGMATDGLEVRSVGNSQSLHESALVEAFNLKAAIEFRVGNRPQAQEALTDMPPRDEDELDPVTLHNHALMYMEEEPTPGFEKLQFLLLSQNPPQALANLLLLHIRHDSLDMAADLLAENMELAYQQLGSFLLDFVEATILCQSAPEVAYQRLEQLATRTTETLRRLTKSVQDAKGRRSDEETKAAVAEYDEALEQYMAVLMQQAKIYWDRQNYSEVERIFRGSVEFCRDHDTWKLNVANVLLMQEKFKDAADFYEGIVKNNYNRILSINAGSLANLCVAYIMVNQNEDAEELMRKIEKEEEVAAYEDPDKRLYHSCIVNLVIGTLYCAKGNYEFGISRVMKSLEPFHKKISHETWFYTKRCFLSLLEKLAMHMLWMRDSAIDECLKFLDLSERHGTETVAHLPSPMEKPPHKGRNTVAYEARLLRALLLQISVCCGE